MKRICIYIIPFLFILLLTACAPTPDSYGDIKKAKELYEKLDSARVVMNDNKTNKPLMDFSFYINKKDEMIFSYENLDNGDMAYSDGIQFYYKTAENDGWSVITPKDEGYIYNIYNRKYRYPYARGGLFFLDGTSVSSAETVRDDSGTTVTYVYDSEKLNDYAAKQLDDVSAFSALTCTYRINADGYITEFTQKGSLTDSSGQLLEMDLTYYILEMNGISFIKSPVDHLAEE